MALMYYGIYARVKLHKSGTKRLEKNSGKKVRND